MKLKKKIPILSILSAASLAHAGYTLNITTSPEQKGKSGQSWFDVSFNGGGNFTYVNKQLWAVDSQFNPLLGNASPFSTLVVDSNSTLKLASGATYASGHSYRLLVDWTLRPEVNSPQAIYFNLSVKNPSKAAMNAGCTDIVSVPETELPVFFWCLLLGLAVLVCVMPTKKD